MSIGAPNALDRIAFIQGYAEPPGQMPYEFRLIRTREWAYAEDLDGDPLALFNMEDDPFQEEDLHPYATYQGVRQDLSDMLNSGKMVAGEDLPPFLAMGID